MEDLSDKGMDILTGDVLNEGGHCDQTIFITSCEGRGDQVIDGDIKRWTETKAWTERQRDRRRDQGYSRHPVEDRF